MTALGFEERVHCCSLSPSIRAQWSCDSHAAAPPSWHHLLLLAIFKLYHVQWDQETVSYKALSQAR